MAKSFTLLSQMQYNNKDIVKWEVYLNEINEKNLIGEISIIKNDEDFLLSVCYINPYGLTLISNENYYKSDNLNNSTSEEEIIKTMFEKGAYNLELYLRTTKKSIELKEGQVVTIDPIGDIGIDPNIRKILNKTCIIKKITKAGLIQVYSEDDPKHLVSVPKRNIILE